VGDNGDILYFMHLVTPVLVFSQPGLWRKAMIYTNHSCHFVKMNIDEAFR